jgi:calcium-dependent protein kinase
MGCTSSKSNGFIESVNGDEEDFNKRYFVDKVLGEGEFGVVKMIYDMTQTSEGTAPAMAVKMLKKGIVFKDNVLYTPLKPEILKRECDILKTLGGTHHCLKLLQVYESKKAILLVTELCAGGEMMQYLSNLQKENNYELTVQDVSRIAFQLLDAMHHCASHYIMHRDIKPENVMFVTSQSGSPLRVIDFGSGAMDTKETCQDLHTTFCGSAFYTSPELFQRTYTAKTDVWSVGVTLYVLVAGYPAEELQKAFNLLQTGSTKGRNLKELPNLHYAKMPESYYQLLEELLQYRHKVRKSAGELLHHDFVQLHKKGGVDDDDDNNNNKDDRNSNNKTILRKKDKDSSVLTGSVRRHVAFLDYVKFERSVTTLIATMVPSEEFANLIRTLTTSKSKTTTTTTTTTTDNILNIVPISELMEKLKDRNQSSWYVRGRRSARPDFFRTLCCFVSLDS